MFEQFVHLHLHSSFSLLDAMNRVTDRTEKIQDPNNPGQEIEIIRPSIANLAKQRGMDTVSLTDHGVLSGLLEFQKECDKHQVKPLLGCETYMCVDRTIQKESEIIDVDPLGRKYYHLILLAKNEIGFKNLSRLTSEAFKTGFYYKPRIDFDLLKQYGEGLIATSACLGGHVTQHLLKGSPRKTVLEVLDQYLEIFGENFFLEIQDNDIEEQYPTNDALIQLAREKGVPIVLTGDVHFPSREDFDLHKKLLCATTNRVIDEGEMKNGKWHYTERHCIESPQEVGRNLDPTIRQEAMNNTVFIANQCDYKIPTGKFIMPSVQVPKGKTAEQLLRKMAEDGLQRFRKSNHPPFSNGIPQAYIERLDMELDAICSLGFADYFLVIREIYDFCDEQGIKYGPGRGSVAGSLVAWAIGITAPALDPIKYKMFFERFLNKGRMESGGVPDVDMDFDVNRREEVFEFIRERWGEEYCARIITFQTFKPKGTIRALVRAEGRSFSQGDYLAKLIPAPRHGKERTMMESIMSEPELEKREPQLVKEVISLEGLNWSSGMHAAGIVISPKPVYETVPVQRAKDKTIITAWDKDLTEEAGLVKFDILGLRNLTIIDTCLKLVEERSGGLKVDLDTIPIDDQAVYEQFQMGDTTGIFQFETSAGFEELSKQIRPVCLEDLAAITALYRPGPIQAGFLERYIAHRNGQEVRYTIPQLEPILNWTEGVIVFQEQILEIAKELAGYTLMEADDLRRAIGKKKMDKIKAERDKFVGGCIKNGIPQAYAEGLFSEIESFADYCFNLSHGCAYSLLSYQTAWLKHYFKYEFLTALFIHAENSDRMIRYLTYAHRQKITVLPPDVNVSGENFTIDETNKIRFGLEYIRDCGRTVVRAIVKERTKGGPYLDLEDFIQRHNKASNPVNRKHIEALIKSGAMDSIITHKKQALEETKLIAEWYKNCRAKALDYAQRLDTYRLKKTLHQKYLDTGDPTEFKMAFPELKRIMKPKEPKKPADIKKPKVPDMGEDFSHRENLEFEREFLGFYVTDNPLNEIISYVYSESTLNTAEAKKAENTELLYASFVGIVSSVVNRTTKSKGEKMATITLQDLEGQIEVIVFPKKYQQYNEFLIEGNIVKIDCRVSYDVVHNSETETDMAIAKFFCEKIVAVDEQELAKAKTFVLDLSEIILDKQKIESVHSLLKEYYSTSNSIPVCVKLPYFLEFYTKHQIKPDKQLMDKLNEIGVAAFI